jgi:hypothetical protein
MRVDLYRMSHNMVIRYNMYRIEDLQQGETIIKYNFGDINTEIDDDDAAAGYVIWCNSRYIILVPKLDNEFYYNARDQQRDRCKLNKLLRAGFFN